MEQVETRTSKQRVEVNFKPSILLFVTKKISKRVLEATAKKPVSTEHQDQCHQLQAFANQ